MADPLATSYLKEVLQLDPALDAKRIIARRRMFLDSSDVVVAAAVGSDGNDSDFRATMTARLNALRAEFWSLDDETLSRRLSQLRQVALPDIAASAARLEQVAALRPQVMRMRPGPALHPHFLDTFKRVLIAPPAEAAQLREAEYRFLCPDLNPDYVWAIQHVRKSVRWIRLNFPQVFQLEEAWLTELLEYRVVDEEELSVSKIFLLTFLVAASVATIGLNIAMLQWIFS